jgi:hypothetical protein
VSPLQSRVFEFVRDRCAAGLPPTGKEIGEALGISDAHARTAVQTLIRAKKLGRNEALKRGLFVPGGTDLRAISTQELVLELERRGEKWGALDSPSDRAFGREKTCAADTCGEVVKVGMLFCRSHWFLLPRDLRTALLESYFSRNKLRFQEALTQARDTIDGCAQPFARQA